MHPSLTRLALAILPALVAFGQDRAAITILNSPPTTVTPGGPITLSLSITNIGGTTWSPIGTTFNADPSRTGPIPYPQQFGTYYVHIQSYNQDTDPNALDPWINVLPLPSIVLPGQTVSVQRTINSPTGPGRWVTAITISKYWVHNFCGGILNSGRDAINGCQVFRYSVQGNSLSDFLFEPFDDLGLWQQSNECNVAVNPGPTHFCASRVIPPNRSPVPGAVTLTGQVLSSGRREGSGLVGPELPVTGTFAARLRFSGQDDGGTGHASIKAFFTYMELGPCQHMEHDFEVLTGRSAVYTWNSWISGEGWLIPSQFRSWTILSPILLTKTHFCPGQPQPQEPQGSESPTRFALRGRFDPNEYITFAVTVRCVQDCGGDRPLYEAEYWAGKDADNSTLIKRTLTRHDKRVLTIRPMFNLWWENPLPSTMSPSTLQSMTVKWFYWNRSVLPFAVAHRTADACDSNGTPPALCR